MEALVAAIQNGADAIYLGGQSFSARASANNFTDEELADAVSYAHFRDVKIYVTVNTILDENELEKSMQYISYLHRIGVDGIIVQDLGLVKSIRDNFPDIELHASTQMTINSLEGAQLLEEMGFARVVLARETPLSEIRLIAENTNLDIEAFAHGALCVSYSGQCLMSSMIGGRSGNRGRCAQSCRKAYKVLKPSGEPLNAEAAYLLSPKDLCTLDNIKDYLEAGVTSVKLEGRMKRPDYVATVTNAYRKAIDEMDTSGEISKLKQSFNRGFTKGFAFGEFGKSYINTERPSNQGITIGRVLKSDRKGTKIELFTASNNGDILEFDTTSGYKTYTVNSDINTGIASLNLPFDVIEGTKIQRMRDGKLFEAATKSYEADNKKAGIKFQFTGKLGMKPILIASSKDYEVEISSDSAIEKSLKNPTTESKIIEQLNKLNDTNFKIDEIKIDIDDEIFLPVSTLNSLRREAVTELNRLIDKGNLREAKKVSIAKNRKKIELNEVKLSISLSIPKQFDNIDLRKVERVYLRFLDSAIIEKIKSMGKPVYYRTDKVLFHEDYLRLKKEISEYDIDGVLIDNLGGIIAFNDMEKISDIGLNVFNSHAIDLLQERGIENIILSPELTFAQISEIRRNSTANLETIGYGFVEVMTLKHCPFSPIKGCLDDTQCDSCNFKYGYYLQDEKGINFRTYRENSQSTIFNSYPISIIDSINNVEKAGINTLLLDFTFEENPEIVIDEFYRAIKGDENHLNEYLKEKYAEITHGHYFRGVK